YHYLKEKLEVESKMVLKYTLDRMETSNPEQKEKGKRKECDDRSLRLPVEYITEDLTCPITYETVDGLYQLSCHHFISFKALLSLKKPECPYCRREIRKDEVFYLPQQIIFKNVQHYIMETAN